jgi:Xaa-Pro aminopeptidase
MQTMHPTLLIGPADWDDEQMPRAEFKVRLEALWRDDWQAGGAIVYGDAADHAALAYLTHFTPKLEPGIALLSRNGDARLLVGGGINMIPAAKPLTWVGNLLPLRSAAKTVAEWYATLPGGSGLMLIGGDAMPYQMRNEIVAALGPDVGIDDGTPIVRALMRRKSTRELAAIEEAGLILGEAIAALQQAKDQGVGAAVLAAEHVAWRRGAQDVRSLFSLDGGRTLVPFDVPVPQTVDPLQVYFAVRCSGYWAEGFAMLSGRPHAPLIAAEAALQAALAQVGPGVKPAALIETIATAMPAFGPHHITSPSVIGVGLSLQQDLPPDEPLDVGNVLSLRAGVSDPQQGAAMVSALVAVTEDGCDVYWSAV